MPPDVLSSTAARQARRLRQLAGYLAVGLALASCNRASEPGQERADIPSGPITIAATGDTLLTTPLERGSPDAGAVRDLLRGATLALTDLEINLLGAEERQLADASGQPRWPFGDDRTIEALRELGIDVVSLANDHATDYGPEGLRSTIRLLDSAGILHAGAGADLAAARAPVFAGTGRRVAFVNVAASSLPESRATLRRTDIAGRPGVSPLRYAADISVDPKTFASLTSTVTALNAGPPPGERELTMFGTVIKKGDRTVVEFRVDADDERAVLEEVRKARQAAEIVVVSLHAHEPSNASDVAAQFVQHFARAAIDAGASLVVGHGPHRLRGVEWYKDGAILYSLGNFSYLQNGIDYRAANMFDRGADLYQVAIGAAGDASPAAPAELNGDAWWEGVVAVATFENGKLSSLKLEPLDLGLDQPLKERGTPRLATGARRAAILERMAALSKPLGTTVGANGVVSAMEP